jgi:putative flippase GtrA
VSRRRRRLPRPLLFAAVGLANTGVDLVVYLALTRLAGTHPVPAAALGFLAGAAHSYLANGLLTFRDLGTPLAPWARVARFAGVTLVCLGTSTLAMAAALPLLPDLAAKLASVLATFAVGYGLSRWLVYAPRAAAPQPADPASGPFRMR